MNNVGLLAVLLHNWSTLGLELHEVQESDIHSLYPQGVNDDMKNMEEGFMWIPSDITYLSF